jgi:hypothetical protein
MASTSRRTTEYLPTFRFHFPSASADALLPDTSMTTRTRDIANSTANASLGEESRKSTAKLRFAERRVAADEVEAGQPGALQRHLFEVLLLLLALRKSLLYVLQSEEEAKQGCPSGYARLKQSLT